MTANLPTGDGYVKRNFAIKKGMVSRFQPGHVPKYIWAVDKNDEVYEAKTKVEQETAYHGYRLGNDERQMRDEVLAEWKKR